MRPRYDGYPGLTGGCMADYIKPIVRAYDDKRRRRPVEVDVHTWRGTAIGAKHWYAKLREADNPALYLGPDDGRLRWACARDDKECDGRRVEDLECLTREEAEAAVLRLFKKHFNDGWHVLVDYRNRSIKWHPRGKTGGG